MSDLLIGVQPDGFQDLPDCLEKEIGYYSYHNN